MQVAYLCEALFKEELTVSGALLILPKTFPTKAVKFLGAK